MEILYIQYIYIYLEMVCVQVLEVLSGVCLTVTVAWWPRRCVSWPSCRPSAPLKVTDRKTCSCSASEISCFHYDPFYHEIDVSFVLSK